MRFSLRVRSERFISSHVDLESGRSISLSGQRSKAEPNRTFPL